jgi:hypothetical protein
MARITVNTQGTHPHVYLTMDTTTLYDGTGSAAWVTAEEALDVTCLQDITVNNSTGIFSWTDFCSEDMNKITTPADNSVSTNMVIDSTVFFGDGTVPPLTALDYGVNGLSATKQYVQWVLVMNGDLTTPTIGAQWYRGLGYITSIAPTVSPDSPVWISPMEIAVTGDMTVGTVAS